MQHSMLCSCTRPCLTCDCAGRLENSVWVSTQDNTKVPCQAMERSGDCAKQCTPTCMMPCHVPPSSHVVGPGSSLQQGNPGRPQHARRLMHLQPLCRMHKAAAKPVGPAKEAAGGWVSAASVPEARSMLDTEAATSFGNKPWAAVQEAASAVCATASSPAVEELLHQAA